MEGFYSISRQNTGFSGMGYLLPKRVYLTEACPAHIRFSDYLGDRRHNHSRFDTFPIHPYLPDPFLPYRLLWNITFQHDVPDSHDSCRLLDLSTYKVHMGFID